jgi:hypothetical protein
MPGSDSNEPFMHSLSQFMVLFTPGKPGQNRQDDGIDFDPRKSLTFIFKIFILLKGSLQNQYQSGGGKHEKP